MRSGPQEENENYDGAAGCLPAVGGILAAVAIVSLGSGCLIAVFMSLIPLLPDGWHRGSDMLGLNRDFVGIQCGVPAGIAVGYLFQSILPKSPSPFRAWYAGTLLLLTVLIAGGLTFCGGFVIVAAKEWLGLIPFVTVPLFILPAMLRAGVFRKRPPAP